MPRHHFCLVRNGSNIEAYIDGVSIGSDNTNTIGSHTSAHYTTIGNLRNAVIQAPPYWMEGNIADARIYDTDLTSTDVSNLYNGTDITTNLVGHWLKDTDDVLDHSTNSNNGENFGSIFSPDNPSPAITFGRASRSFDGVGDYITAPDGSWLPTGTQTWACWVKRNNQGVYAIFNHNSSAPNRSIQIVVTQNNTIQFQVSQDGTGREDLASGSTLSQGEWYHVACVFNPSASSGQQRRIYINGTLDVNASTNYTALHDTSEDVGMGANGAGLFHLDGKLADCRIYDADLSSTDISDLYNGTNITTNLIGHWLTDNDDVNDYAGTNDGTNVGSTYSYDAPFPANKLIDTYASTCGAYSLRELSTTWAGQSVVDVRRASDDTVQSFTEAQISDGTLATFCGTQGGFVSKIYDQSGNGFDLIQPTAGSQPRIYTGVTQSVVTDNGKPALDFSGAYMYNAGSFDYEGGVSWVCVLNANLVGTSGQRIWCDDITGTQGYLNFSPTQYNLNDGAGYASLTVTGATTNQQIRSFYFNEATANYLYRMDETESSTTLSGFTQGTIEISGTSANIGLMGAGNGGQNLAGLWQELVIYPNDQRHNRLNIERNVNEYYSVY